MKVLISAGHAAKGIGIGGSILHKFAVALEDNNSRLEAIEGEVKSMREKVGI